MEFAPVADAKHRLERRSERFFARQQATEGSEFERGVRNCSSHSRVVPSGALLKLRFARCCKWPEERATRSAEPLPNWLSERDQCRSTATSLVTAMPLLGNRAMPVGFRSDGELPSVAIGSGPRGMSVVTVPSRAISRIAWFPESAA